MISIVSTSPVLEMGKVLPLQPGSLFHSSAAPAKRV